MHARLHRHVLTLGSLLGLVGCTTAVVEASAEQVRLTSIPTVAPELGAALPSDWDEATPLSRGEAHVEWVGEVWLDPEASAALSLDQGGGVRLWPALEGESDALEPVVLPIDEPARLSFSRTAAGTFLIAAIDMSQLGRVLEVRRSASGNFEAIERMRFSVDEPLFELHVLPGGERVLALGVDHRLRLFDRSGALLSELSEHGLSPWQLRLVGRGDTLAAAVVHALPTRIQRLSLADDRLQLVGESRRIYNDRGPNLNDLQLLPGGTHATAFRRPNAKSNEWSLELIDIASGEVRVMKGKVESRIRSRLHIVDEQRALLEDGSGTGYWVDLRGGVVMPPDFMLPEDLDDLPDESFVETQRIPLAGSIDRQRWHASIVEGLRVVPHERDILLDPIDDDTHRVLGHRGLWVTGVGFVDEHQVAWSTREEPLVESVVAPGVLQPLGSATARWGHEVESPVTVAGFLFTSTALGIEMRTAQGHVSLLTASGSPLQIVPSPDARWLAIVDEREPTKSGGLAKLRLSLLSLAPSEMGRKVWDIPLDGEVAPLSWSPAGELLGVVNGGQAMVLRAEGELLFERTNDAVRLEPGNDGEVSASEVSEARRAALDALPSEFTD